jgi:hypothetical protein
MTRRFASRVGGTRAAVWIMGLGRWNNNGEWFDQSVWVD